MSIISTNGTSYQVSGALQAQPLIFIHGLGLNRHIWAPYVKAFEADYRVVTYDLFGHGASAAPPHKPDLSVYAQQIVMLMDELGIDRAILIGFSLGGMINRRVTMDYADRVAALVILNSPHERSPAAQRLVEERARDTASGGIAATLDATFERWFTESYRLHNADYIQQVRDWLLANNLSHYYDARQVLATGVIELIDPRPAITQPTLVITCENDSGSTPDMSRAIASEIDKAQTLIVQQLKHMGLVERPDLFIEPISTFLGGIGRQTP